MLLTDMQDFLQQNGVTIPIYTGNMPHNPITCITLFEYAGMPVESGTAITPGLQLLLRTNDFESGYQQLETATTSLLQIGYENGEMPQGVVINETSYFLVYTPNSGINQLGKDENGNILLSKNFYVVRGI